MKPHNIHNNLNLNPNHKINKQYPNKEYNNQRNKQYKIHKPWDTFPPNIPKAKNYLKTTTIHPTNPKSSKKEKTEKSYPKDYKESPSKKPNNNNKTNKTAKPQKNNQKYI